MFSILGVFLAMTATAFSDPNVDAAIRGISKFYAAHGDYTHRTVLKVNSNTQVAYGTVYQLALDVKVGSEIQVCYVKVLEKHWIQGGQERLLIEDPQCWTSLNQPSTTTPSSPTFISIDVTSEKVQTAKNYAENFFNSESTHSNIFKMTSISTATISEINSIVYTIKLFGVQMSETSCPNNKYNDYHDYHQCQVVGNGMVKTCDFVVSVVSYAFPTVTQTCNRM